MSAHWCPQGRLSLSTGNRVSGVVITTIRWIFDRGEMALNGSMMRYLRRNQRISRSSGVGM